MTAYKVTYIDWSYDDDNSFILGYYSNYCRAKHAVMKHAAKYMSFTDIRKNIPETMLGSYMRIIMDEKNDYVIEEILIE